MRTVEQAKTDVAAVIGRWQVDDLHVGHRTLLQGIKSQHRKVIVFVGVPSILGSIENPLDFPTRAAMIQQHYPEFIILPIADRKCDNKWSEDLDRLVRTVAPIGEVTFYGGRDSFVKHYHGKFRTIELDALRYPSGTDIREEVGREVRASSDFRAGVIYSSFNQYRRVFMAADIACVKAGMVLLGAKEGETTVRFPGGFVDFGDTSLEAAARRECREETGIFPETLEYLGSYIVEDDRMGRNDTILSAFFLGTVVSNIQIEAIDDLQIAKWVPIGDLRDMLWHPNHKAMFERLCEKLGV